MDRRKFLTNIATGLLTVGLADTALANSGRLRRAKHRASVGPAQAREFRMGPGTSTHGSTGDEPSSQIDRLELDCMRAGGGMSTEDGNFMCRDADGNPTAGYE